MSLRVLPTSAERPPEAQVSDDGLAAVEGFIVHGRGWVGAEFNEAARDSNGAGHLTRGGDLGRLADVEKKNIRLADQSLGFIRTDARHRGLGFSKHALYCLHHAFSTPWLATNGCAFIIYDLQRTQATHPGRRGALSLWRSCFRCARGHVGLRDPFQMLAVVSPGGHEKSLGVTAKRAMWVCWPLRKEWVPADAFRLATGRW